MESLFESGRGILIAEDHRPTVDLLLALLAAAFPACPIQTAFSAEEALERCQAAAPKVVIMDIGLPGMNGIDATRHIKATLPTVHVVVHSSLDPSLFADACTQAGASAFVSKGTPQVDLIPLVAKLLSDPEGI